MLGAIVGDIVGSGWFEQKAPPSSLLKKECHYSDDTVLTLATAEAIMSKIPYSFKYRQFAQDYPEAGYGFGFSGWVESDGSPYNSCGNGSAMRVSPIGWIFNDLDEVLIEAKKSAECTHNHPEGIKGAQAVAASIFLLRNGKTKDEVKEFIEQRFSYNLSRSVSQLQKEYKYSELCQESVPEALICFLESTSFEDSLRKTISIGGDVDTLCAINGSIAEAFYNEIPTELVNFSISKIDKRLQSVIDRFSTIKDCDKITL